MKAYISDIQVSRIYNQFDMYNVDNYKSSLLPMTRDTEITIKAILKNSDDCDIFYDCKEVKITPVGKIDSKKLEVLENISMRGKYKVSELIGAELSKLRLKDEKAFQDVRDIYLSEHYFLDFIQEEQIPGKLSELYNSILKFDKYRIIKKQNKNKPALMMKTQNGNPNIELDDGCPF